MTAELRHGYTMADLDDVSRLAVCLARTLSSGHWAERYETAWSAIAEHLYAAEHWPQRHQLVHAGVTAILKQVTAGFHHHGYYMQRTAATGGGHGSSPAFVAYWREFAHHTGSHEDRIVDREALYQILPRLSPAESDAVLALAVNGDYQVAAAFLGISENAFKLRISLARRRFLAWWHEGEEPSKPWGRDRRVGYRAGEPRQGGTAMRSVRRRKRAS